MDKTWQPAKYEQIIYKFWEDGGFFSAKISKDKKPFSIILPPPNANGDLHFGHAMYVFEDIMIRYYKMMDYATLWLPGTDHAGIETQYVFEKNLKKEGKSRFDFDRETLFKMIWEFTMINKPNIEKQLKRLGFALDWSKNKFTLDKDIVALVYKTFKQLYDANLLYREEKLVNYCVRDGTSFSDLEVNYVERKDPLYYIKYGPFVLATTRPETKFGDTAVAVNPKDKRYQKWIGKQIEVEGLIGKFKLRVIADDFVDPKFGTGVVKVTPAHDFDDFEVGKKHHLPLKQVIGYDGKLNAQAGKYQGLFVTKARKIIAEDLEKAGLIDKIDPDYVHRIGVCYKCGTTIEPLPLEQWFIKVKPLAAKAKQLVESKQIKVYPKRFSKVLGKILDDFHDWNISRQIVWGIRIPAWQCKKCGEWIVTEGQKPKMCIKCQGSDLKQDEDTFDTWFSSSQWPFATLQSIGSEWFDYFYPTTVMETGYDILRAWVARMIMIGYFVTKKPPFQTIFLHGMVRDAKGQKMSKSKGNVINPLDKVNQYGADAWRASLLFGLKEGADISLPEDRIIGMRNFANKVWNIGRFLRSNFKSKNNQTIKQSATLLTQLNNEFKQVEQNYHKMMNAYQFSKALETVYDFLWHRFADYYLEQLKEGFKNGKIEAWQELTTVYLTNLKMLHPFMPFVTEALWKIFKNERSSILKQNF